MSAPDDKAEAEAKAADDAKTSGAADGATASSDTDAYEQRWRARYEHRMTRRAERRERRAHRSGMGGVVLVVIGLLFLGINFGWWDANVWWVLWRFWPIFIVLVGLRILLPRSRIYSWLVLAVAVAFFALVALGPAPLRSWGLNSGTTSSQMLSTDLGQAKHLNLNVKYGAAEVVVRPLATTSKLLYEADYDNSPSVRKAVSTSGDTTTITLDEGDGHWMMWGPNSRKLTLYVSRGVTVDLTLDTGASRLTADLSDLQLSKLTLKSGASSSDLKLGRLVNKLTANIDSGAASLTLRVPREYAARINFDGGLSSQNFVAAGLEKDGDTYATPDYANAAKQIDITLSAGASAVHLERYQ